MGKTNTLSMILLIVGLLIVFGTHIWMLMNGLPQEQVTAHSWINIGAGVILLASYFTKK